MKKKIDWLNHFLEFAVVLIGIMIAFQLNQCSQERTQQKLVDEHRQYLLDETRFNQKNVDNAIESAQYYLSSIDTVLSLIERNQGLESVNRLALELLNIGTVYIRKNAYTSLIQSGDVRYIREFEAKRRIIDLYEYYQLVATADKIALDSYLNDYYPYLKANFDLANRRMQARSVYRSRTFLNALSTYRYGLMNRLAVYKNCRDRMAEYIEWAE